MIVMSAFICHITVQFWDKSCLVTVCDFFVCCWMFSSALLIFFSCVFIKNIGLQFSCGIYE